MRISLLALFLALIISSIPALAADSRYLDRMAFESEIKSIAVVSRVQRMGAGAEGTFLRVTFKTDYALTSFTPESFTGGCNTMESAWQQRSPGTVYFNPKQGQKVFVTVSSNDGAITSLTPLTPLLDAVVRTEPWRLTYNQGRAVILPKDD
ncbi:hypothetical protein GKC30_06785 [Pseudodesulfovibrio sp. F-1]|uniref:Uncharacterized protein n=1 Tax=Pseudodesulfovibrio alkaliphilus TaxID=2661613 RepID=A0A7K1KMM2_9BACT|nr:hypothetical protein [Pseudodesulfovibrio alkaliphilus]MUM77333.1 hypothetical protein [Pseudodesulfovibrio alkaliphilus]